LSEEEIERMVREAEQFAESDKAMRQTVDARNGLEGYAYNMRNSIEDEEKLGGKLSEQDKETIEEAINEVIEWLDDNTEATKEEYDAKLNEIEAICNPIVSEIYQASGMGGSSKAEGEVDFDDFDHDQL